MAYSSAHKMLGLLIVLALHAVVVCAQPSQEVETERNRDYEFCDRIAKVKVYIQMEDGSMRHIHKVPFDLICEYYSLQGFAGVCTYDNESRVVDVVHDRLKNLSLVDEGVFGLGSRLDPVYMRLVSFYTKYNHSDSLETAEIQGCNGTLHHERIPEKEQWLGLIERGNCLFNDKAHNVVNKHKSSGFILYNSNDPEAKNSIMNISVVENITSLMVTYNTGISVRFLEEALEAVLASNNTLGYTDKVYANVTYLHTLVDTNCYTPPKETPLAVTIVTITFVVVMVVALGWLVIYYFQRHRSVNKQEILQLKLQKAARKALSKIGERIITEEDMTDDDCTYCISPLVVNETIRQLPCGHKFHKGCVEDWLIEKRTCPNCQDNILIATKTTIRGVKDVAAAEDEGPATEMTNMAPEQRMLLSDSQAIDGYSESGTECPPHQWGSQVIPGSQLLTDGQNMFLLVPDHVELPPDSTIQIDNNGTDSRPVSIAAASSSANQNTATTIAPPTLCSATPLSQSQQRIIAAEQHDKISIEQTM